MSEVTYVSTLALVGVSNLQRFEIDVFRHPLGAGLWRVLVPHNHICLLVCAV